MQNIIDYQKKCIKKNPIAKDYKFVAEQYIHNVLTAVRNDHKLYIRAQCYASQRKIKRVSYINTFRYLINYLVYCSVSQIFFGKTLKK